MVLRSGDRFEKDKTALLQCLGAGERRMIFSSYQTLGAGQNLQYPVQDHDGLVVLGLSLIHIYGRKARSCCIDPAACLPHREIHSENRGGCRRR